MPPSNRTAIVPAKSDAITDPKGWQARTFPRNSHTYRVQRAQLHALGLEPGTLLGLLKVWTRLSPAERTAVVNNDAVSITNWKQTRTNSLPKPRAGVVLPTFTPEDHKRPEEL